MPRGSIVAIPLHNDAMGKIIWIVVLFFGVPAGLFLLLDNALSSQEHEWYESVLKDRPPEIQQRYTLSFVCYSPEVGKKVDLSAVCKPYKNTRHLRAIALGTVAAPVLYSLVLVALSFRCRADRTLLLRIFRPGIYASTIMVATLLLLQWLLFSGVLYGFGLGRLTEDGYFWIVLLGVVAVVGAFFIVRPILRGVPRAKTTVIGIQLKESEYPRIWDFMRHLAAQVGARHPDNIVVGFTPNFFVTEATVDCISGTLEGATMYLSLPLCRILSIQELSAVVFHELSHFKGEDAKFTIHFYPIYRGISDSLYGVSNASAQIANIGSYIPIAGFKLMFIIASLFLLPSIYLLRFFFDAFSYAESQISRERELAADALAAHVQGSEPIATALVKLAAFSSIWDGVVQWAKEANAEGIVRLGEESYEPRQFFSNMSQLFCAMVQDTVSPDRLKDLDLVKSSHPTDTHPPLSIRLNALNTSLTATGHNALAVVIENPSSDLIDNVAALEVSLSDFQQRLVTA
jgi:Zn-dependent protease with chaperone function